MLAAAKAMANKGEKKFKNTESHSIGGLREKSREWPCAYFAIEGGIGVERAGVVVHHYVLASSLDVLVNEVVVQGFRVASERGWK